VIAPTDWLLTAAHCFGILDPHSPFSIDVTAPGSAGATYEDPPVFLHPQAVPALEGSNWTQAFDPTQTDCAHDLALVRLDHSVPGVTPVPVYHFGCRPGLEGHGCDDMLDDAAASFGGSAASCPGTGTQAEATGHLQAGRLGLGYADEEGGCGGGVQPHDLVIFAQGQPVGEPGDSGGGLLVAAPESSVSFSGLCDAPTTAAQGETALVGVAVQPGVFAPVYLADWSAALQGSTNTSNSDWLQNTFLHSRDNDIVCDEVDNCPDVTNPDQANSNRDAEDAWGQGVHLGDACDPAPTPVVSLPAAAVSAAFGNTRAVADHIGVRPVVEPSSPVPSSDSDAQALFCLCRGTDGTPIADKDRCKTGPWFCALNPYENPDGGTLVEGVTPRPGFAVLPGHTTWHVMAIQTPGAFCLHPPCFPSIPLSYSFTAPTQTVGTWLYQQDNERWNGLGYFANHPVTPDPSYPFGTDLGGVLWATDDGYTSTDIQDQHHLASQMFINCGTPGCPVTAMADSYDFGVAPDRKVPGLSLTRTTHFTGIPFGGPPTSGSALFVGESSEEPVPFVTIDPVTDSSVYWLSGFRRFSADDVLSAKLRQELVDPTLRWVPASEPATVTQSTDLERAVALSSDGSQVADALVRTDTGYLTLSEQEIHEDPPLASATGQLPGSSPPPRSGFGAAWSRAAGLLSVVGGHDASGQPTNDVWTIFVPTEWHGFSLFGADPPASIEATTYAWKDDRLWLVDDTTHEDDHGQDRHEDHGAPSRVLYRVDPNSGYIDGTWPLRTLGWADQVWLTTAEDGRVLLTATDGRRWLLALMSDHACATDDSQPSQNRPTHWHDLHGSPPARSCRHGVVEVDGLARGTGQPVAPPQIFYEHVTGAFLEERHGTRLLDVRFMADLGKLQHGRGDLDDDLE
jgi:hypothetical protein